MGPVDAGDSDDEGPLSEVPTSKPKVAAGVPAFSMGRPERSGADLFEEENAAVAGEDVTVLLQAENQEFAVKVRAAQRPGRAVPAPT